VFELTRRSSVPLVDQIVTRIVQLVQHGQLAEGTRVPSIRKLAKLVGASPFTVADAYDRLVARGVIESRAGRGFFVARRRANGALAVIESMPDPGTGALALARASMTLPSEIIAAGSGFLPSQRGIAASADHLVTTFGASQAFDLLARILLSPGDAVLVEDPGFFVLFEQLRAHHVRLVPIPRRDNGPDAEAVEAACRAHRPRAFFMQTLLHNPTGTNAEPAVCHRLLSLAEQYGFAIIEDDVYGDLYDGPAVRMAQIDGLRHVIHVGSFTKLIGPPTRLGFIAADAALISQLVERKVLSVCTGSALLETIVSEALDSGRYRRHCERTRTRLARMRRDARTALESAGVTFADTAGEGIFLWGRVPESVKVDELVRHASEKSILLAKGALFSPVQGSASWLRFNAAHSSAPELVRFLGNAVREAA
jgi:DNA-binding transcriptional MocR family regulator